MVGLFSLEKRRLKSSPRHSQALFTRKASTEKNETFKMYTN